MALGSAALAVVLMQNHAGAAQTALTPGWHVGHLWCSPGFIHLEGRALSGPHPGGPDWRLRSLVSLKQD